MFAGLQIAVDDAVPVCGGKRVRDFDAEAEDLCERQRPAFETRRQRLPFKKFEDEELRVMVAADVVQAADVRVIERGDRLSLGRESGAEFCVTRQLRREHLHGDLPVEACVASPVHLAHASGPHQGRGFRRGPAVYQPARACARGLYARLLSSGHDLQGDGSVWGAGSGGNGRVRARIARSGRSRAGADARAESHAAVPPACVRRAVCGRTARDADHAATLRADGHMNAAAGRDIQTRPKRLVKPTATAR